MSRCTYVRRVKKQYEYGHIEIKNGGTPKEERIYVPSGLTDSIEGALSLNNMALAGQPKIKPQALPTFWDARI